MDSEQEMKEKWQYSLQQGSGWHFLAYFWKKREHQATYKSGGNKSQVDCILCRRDNLREVSACKVLHGDSVVRHHGIVVCRVKLVTRVKRGCKMEPNLRLWKLKEEDYRLTLQHKVKEELEKVFPEDWEKTAEFVREVAKDVLGVSSAKKSTKVNLVVD